MVIDDVLDHGDPPPVALPHEAAVLLTATGTRLDHEVVAVAVPPSSGALELGHGEKLDRVHSERLDMVQEADGIGQIASARPTESERADMELVDDEVLNRARDWPARSRTQPAQNSSIGTRGPGVDEPGTKDRRIVSGSTTRLQLTVPSSVRLVSVSGNGLPPGSMLPRPICKREKMSGPDIPWRPGHS